ncbi:hypothetical protein DSO57_1027225 [Entomophthora muscae]|uniref:Uncharacterized protein n=1 Tax=Entomophthora muscae TaxID=34485 RepID=A0ACC2RGJ7_9FUNG|nr:hypothetical protein DSO57_1027225 [Entomophthora muscae]
MSYSSPYQIQSNVASGGNSVPPLQPPTLPSNAAASVQYDRRMVHFQEFLIDWKKSQPDNCCVCLDSIPGVDNDLLFCASPNCDVCIHQECYGVRVSPAPDEAWFCDRCRSPDYHTASCKLCPLKRGALKKLKDGSAWIHVVCALWWPQVKVDDSNGLEIIAIRDIAPENFNQRCVICDNPQDSHIGACVSCDYAGCSNKFHITCAQEWDLLEESTDVTKLKPGQEPYYVYCKQHGRHPQPQVIKLSIYFLTVKMNPWALWSRKKDIYYDSLCKNNLELVQSVQEREKPISYTRDRRRSIQHNDFMLPPIESFNPLNALIESPQQNELHVSEESQAGLIQKFESAYSAYEKERSDFVSATEQVQSRQLTILDNLSQKSFLSAQRATKFQRDQQALEQENRSLQLEVSELKYGLLNLCSIRGLRMIQKVMGRPKDGLEFYPHQDMILNYFLEVSHHIVNSNSEERTVLPPRSCICGGCGHVVDFSISTISCSVCSSWSHMRCIPSPARPSDCTKLWICKGCQSIDRSAPNGERHDGPSNARNSRPNRSSSLGPTESDTKPQNAHSSELSSFSKRFKTEQSQPILSVSYGIESTEHQSGSPNSGVSKQDSKQTEEPPAPYQQSPRFPGDEYTPRWVRGIGKAKEGLCPHCTDRQVWLKIKISAYWYHLNYQHGISSITGKSFRPPLEYRINPETELKEALCHKCRNWINSESPRNKPVNVEEIYWWKHAQKCHQ